MSSEVAAPTPIGQLRRGVELLSRFDSLSDEEAVELAGTISAYGSLSGLIAAALEPAAAATLDWGQARFARLYRLLLRLLAYETELSALGGQHVASQLDVVSDHLAAGRIDDAEQALAQLWSELVAAVERLPQGAGGLLALGLADLVADL